MRRRHAPRTRTRHLSRLLTPLLLLSASLHAQDDAPVCLEAFLGRITGEAGFEMGYSGEPIFSKLTYELDGEVVGLRGELRPRQFSVLGIRGEVFTSLSMSGESEDFDWDDAGALSDYSLSRSDITLTGWHLDLIASRRFAPELRADVFLGYAAQSYDIETSDLDSRLSDGLPIPFTVPGVISHYALDFVALRVGAAVDLDLADGFALRLEAAYLPWLQAESSANWLLRDYPFWQEAMGAGYMAAVAVSYAFTPEAALFVGVEWGGLIADINGTESGIADGIEPYANEPAVAEITTEYTIAQLGARLQF